MGEPSATVVIPCFNHGRFLPKAVQSALEQVGARTRVIVVNDGSDDGSTPAACDRLCGDRVMVVHQENRGLSAARNAGARLASDEHLVFLDADDWITPRFVMKLSRALEGERVSARDPALVSHAYCQERLVELGRGLWKVPEWDPLLLMITNLHPVTCLVRREAYEAAGGFDESMREGYEDWDLWLRFAERGWRGVRVREPLFVWRRHSHTTMVMKAVQLHEKLYRGLMERHRELYERHAGELVARQNAMLRRFDANWIDETGYPIPLRALWNVRESYESMAAVKLHHAIHGAINALPRPVASAARGALGVVKRAIPRPGRG